MVIPPILAVFDIDKKKRRHDAALELAPGVKAVDEVSRKTEASFKIDPKLKH